MSRLSSEPLFPSVLGAPGPAALARPLRVRVMGDRLPPLLPEGSALGMAPEGPAPALLSVSISPPSSLSSLA